MNQLDPSQTEELQRIACACNVSARIVAPEQLRSWLYDRRNEAIEARRSARKIVERMSREIAAIDQKLAELKIR